jgi:hypothetical protein
LAFVWLMPQSQRIRHTLTLQARDFLHGDSPETQVNVFPKVNMISKVTWGYIIQSFPGTRTCAVLNVKFMLFLSDFNQNWILLTDFSRTGYKIS